MQRPNIVEVSHLWSGILVTFADGKVVRLTADELYALAVSPDSLPQFFKSE
jgi:hypothetical protein